MFLTQIAYTKKDLPEKQHMYTVRLAKRTFFYKHIYFVYYDVCFFQIRYR